MSVDRCTVELRSCGTKVVVSASLHAMHDPSLTTNRIRTARSERSGEHRMLGKVEIVKGEVD